MFGLMRRSYVARLKAKQPGSSSVPPAVEAESSTRSQLLTAYSADSRLGLFAVESQIETGTSGSLPIEDLGLGEPFVEDPMSRFLSPPAMSTGPLRTLTREEGMSEVYSIRIATFLGYYHKVIGFNEATEELEAPLIYYQKARERMMMSSAHADGYTRRARLMSTRVAAKMETAIRNLMATRAKRLGAVYNFFCGEPGEGTIKVNANGDIVDLNADPVTGRSNEKHDNIAILARWTHMQGFMSRDEPGLSSEVVQYLVYNRNLLPYHQALLGRPPNDAEVRRFWNFMLLEYCEYWFYFFQSANPKALYTMTFVLQRIDEILGRLAPGYDHVASLAGELDLRAFRP